MRTKANRERARAARYAITFGLEADAVREGPCVAFDLRQSHPDACGCVPRTDTIEDSLVLRWDPAHIVSVGAGGGRFDLISLCSAHHRQQHNMGIDSFAAMYGLDLRALADERALGYEPPLGVRGLAARWAFWHQLDADLETQLVDDAPGDRLVGYDKAALLAWAVRRMAAEVKYASAGAGLGFTDPHGHLTEVIGSELELDDERLSHAEYLDRAWDLCELAGWPS